MTNHFCDPPPPIDWQAKYIRALADLTNLQRQTTIEAERSNKQGQDKILNALLPVLDSLEAAMLGGGNSASVIHEQFKGILTTLGVSRIACVKQKFDPALHEAIQQTNAYPDLVGIIVNEMQAGYIHKDGRLIRAAKVVVGK